MSQISGVSGFGDGFRKAKRRVSLDDDLPEQQSAPEPLDKRAGATLALGDLYRANNPKMPGGQAAEPEDAFRKRQRENTKAWNDPAGEVADMAIRRKAALDARMDPRIRGAYGQRQDQRRQDAGTAFDQQMRIREQDRMDRWQPETAPAKPGQGVMAAGQVPPSRRDAPSYTPVTDAIVDFSKAIGAGDRGDVRRYKPTANAIETLRTNPGSADDFDAMFGPGTAQKYLR